MVDIEIDLCLKTKLNKVGKKIKEQNKNNELTENLEKFKSKMKCSLHFMSDGRIGK